MEDSSPVTHPESRLTVLLVEANPLVRSLLGDFLEYNGYAVTAVERIAAESAPPADLVVADDAGLLDRLIADDPERAAIHTLEQGLRVTGSRNLLVLQKPFRLSTFARAVENRRQKIVALRIARHRLAHYERMPGPARLRVRMRHLLADLHDSLLGYVLLFIATLALAWLINFGVGDPGLPSPSPPDSTAGAGMNGLREDRDFRKFVDLVRQEVEQGMRNEKKARP